MNARHARWVVLAVVAISAASHAAKRPFLIGHDGSMVTEGDVEAETWLDTELNPVLDPKVEPAYKGAAPTGWLWWAGVYWSPHEDLEVRAFTSVIQRDGGASSLWAELLSLRWRFLSGGAGSLTAQLDLRIPILLKLPWQISPSLSWSKKVERFTFSAQAGYAAGFRGTVRYHWVTWDAGVAVDVVKGELAPPFQIGVEGFGEGTLSGNNDLTSVPFSTANVGPTISVARGRLWFTAGALFGVTKESPTVFFRGMIGLAI